MLPVQGLKTNQVAQRQLRDFAGVASESGQRSPAALESLEAPFALRDAGGQHGVRQVRRSGRERLPPPHVLLELRLEGGLLRPVPTERADDRDGTRTHAVVGEVVSGLGLLQQLLEDLVDVDPVLGRAFDVAVLPVEDDRGFDALLRDGVVERKVGLVADDDDRNLGVLGLVDHVSQPRNLLPRLRRVHGEDDDESVRRREANRLHRRKLVNVGAGNVLDVETDRPAVNLELPAVHVVHRLRVDRRKLVVQKLPDYRRLTDSFRPQDQDSVVALGVGQV